MSANWGLLTCALISLSQFVYAGGPTVDETLRFASRSVPTVCVEEDNIDVRFFGSPRVLEIKTTHPSYDLRPSEACEPDFANCHFTEALQYSFAAAKMVESIGDKHETVVELVRERQWWQENGMTVTIEDREWKDIHYLAVSRRVDRDMSWPQVLVLYADGNMRIKPQPPVHVTDTCFGSSVIVGPIKDGRRPTADIERVDVRRHPFALRITYRSGGNALLTIRQADRAISRVRVELALPDTHSEAIASFRSMYVSPTNADVEFAQWRTSAGRLHTRRVMELGEDTSGTVQFFRKGRSKHNPSAPDITVRVVSVRERR